MTPLPTYRFFDHLVDVLLDGRATNEACSVVRVRTPPGYQTALHVHPYGDQLFSVIDGEQTQWIGDQRSVLRAGDSQLAPRAVPHTFRNTGHGMLSSLVISLPAGLEHFVHAFGTRALDQNPEPLDTPPDMALAASLALRGGIELLGPPGMLPSELPASLLESRAT